MIYPNGKPIVIQCLRIVWDAQRGKVECLHAREQKTATGRYCPDCGRSVRGKRR